jgi:hypothetical protein
MNELKCITYSKFDNIAGPELQYSCPSGVITNELFESLSEYVIVSKQLCEKIIVIEMGEIKYLNLTVAVDNAKYSRNTLTFAFGFILPRNLVMDLECYEAALRKISVCFLNLEVINS